MSYVPLNNTNFEIGDKVVCIENRLAKVFDHKTGFRVFSNENLPFLILKKEYEVITKDSIRRKVGILIDAGKIKQVPYYRLGVKETQD